MSAFNIIALDKNYQIVALLRPTNVQWNRKYYESGSFSVQIPLNQYSSKICYIYTKDRPEIGKVMQINYMSQSGFRYMQLSGYFAENDLNRHIAYQKGTSNISNGPIWVEQIGNAEDVAYTFFNAFKSIGTVTDTSQLNISSKTSLGRGNQVWHHRNGEYLGNKIYDILKPSEMSYRVFYDFESNERTLGIWQGKDRTEQNTDGNNPVVFSTKYGNVKNPNVLISEENYKNACIVTHTESDGENDVAFSRLIFNTEPDNEGQWRMLPVASTINKSDYDDMGFLTALTVEGINALADYSVVTNVEFDSSAGSYKYMVDFDLGDKCSIEIPEMELSMDARIIGCYEVMKSGQWFLTLEFGTPILKK